MNNLVSGIIRLPSGLDSSFRIKERRQILFLFHRLDTKSSSFTSAGATSENTTFGVYEWNKNRSYTEKNKKFCFFYAQNCNNLVYSNASTITSET